MVVATYTCMVPAMAQSLAGYDPISSVLDQARIDLDQRSIVIDLDQRAIEADMAEDGLKFYLAQSMYRLGAHSKSYAELTFNGTTSTGLPQFVAEGTAMRGTTRTGVQVRGNALADAPAGSQTVMFLYTVGTDPLPCYVGSLPEESQYSDGCLDDRGSIDIADQDTIQYSYDFQINNKNARTLAGFSTSAKDLMHDCDTCPYKTYEKFIQYYGEYDYGHQIITTALYQGQTSFKNGNHDFSKNYQLGIPEIVSKGVVCLNVWMYVIRQMEYALDLCQNEVLQGNQDSASAWDEAVAYYVGSLEGTDGKGDGVLLYDLADKQCINFRTCGEYSNSPTGTSSINIQVMRAFKAGQNDLRTGQCDAARLRKEEIETLMAVPLIQGTLRYAYTRDYDLVETEAQDAAGAIFAAAILPLVYACSENDAQVIYDSMRAGLYDSDFPNVKRALEANYQCMGISCADVGGVWQESGGYYANAGPCSDSGPNVGAIVGGVIGGIVGVLLIIVVYMKCTGRSCGRCGAHGKDNSFVVGEPCTDPAPPATAFKMDDVGVQEESPVEQDEKEIL